MNRRATRRLILSAGVGTIGALVEACGDGGTAGSGALAPSAGPVKLAYLSNLADTHPEGAARLGLLAEYQKEFTSKVSIDIEEARRDTS